MRPSPDKDWEPGFRGSHANYNEEHIKLMQELQTREIQPEDYDALLTLETRSNVISLAKFLALGYEKANPLPQSYFTRASHTCNFCEMNIEELNKGMQFVNCDHCVHKACLEDMFRLKKN